MKKIQTKITVLFLITAMIVALINMGMGMLITRYSTMEALRDTLVETAETSALAAQNMIATYTYTVSEIASHPQLTDDELTPEEKHAYLNDRAEAYAMRSAGLANAKGYDAINKANVSEEPFFQAAMEGQAYMSSPYISEDKSDMHLVVSAPVMKGNKVDSVVYFQCDATILQSIVESIMVGEGGDAYILDKNGTTIAYADVESVLNQENVMADAAENPDDKYLQQLADIEQQMVQGKTGVGEYHYEEDNSDNIQSYAPIQGTDGWSVAITVNQGEFMRPAYIGNLILVVLFVVTFIIVLLISRTIGRAIARPVVVCSQRLQQLSQGDLQSPIPEITTKDETRILADSTAELVGHLRQILEEFSDVLEQIAGGDLTAESDIENYPGEFISLHRDLELIGDKLNITIGEIADAADNVSEGAEHMSATSAALSQGSLEQANAVERLSANIDGVSREAQNAVQLANEAKETAESAGQQMSESNRYLGNLTGAMERITASSDEIEKIITTIESIAFQTNILALNAAVEAARAGEAGKGFAIVADEVRNLAAKSDEAAKATRELIINSVDAVDEGSQVVDHVVKSMTEVMGLAGEAVSKMEVVAGVVEHQTEAIMQIGENVDQISAVVQTNTTSANESAQASNRLAVQAENLTKLVDSFKLEQ